MVNSYMRSSLMGTIALLFVGFFVAGCVSRSVTAFEKFKALPPQGAIPRDMADYRAAWVQAPDAQEWRAPLLAFVAARAGQTAGASSGVGKPSEAITAEALLQLKELNALKEDGAASEESIRLATVLLRQETSDSLRYYALRLMGDYVDDRAVRQTIVDYKQDPDLTIAYEVRLLLDAADR